MSALLHLLLVSTALFNSFAESAGGFMETEPNLAKEEWFSRV
ncbi:unnamed protein product, partial [Mesorhabditis belari]|uniref:Uncharacterized protein n=1 Tax=Mesorhabditis belari TaxID=2138241 RepID=A0AAF3EX38_9BILA